MQLPKTILFASFIFLVFWLGSCVKGGICGAEFNPSFHEFDTSDITRNHLFISNGDSLELVIDEAFWKPKDTLESSLNVGGGAQDCSVGFTYCLWTGPSNKTSSEFIYIEFFANVTQMNSKERLDRKNDFTFKASTECGRECSFIEQDVNNLNEVNTDLIETDDKTFFQKVSFKNGKIYQFQDSANTIWINSDFTE